MSYRRSSSRTASASSGWSCSLAKLLKQIDLPGLTIPGNIFLAPMAGYTDAAFRSVCIDRGAYLCFTEMVSAEALSRGNQKTLQLLERAENEAFWGVQIFGSDPCSTAQAVRLLERYRPSLYDLNCGCSVPKVLKSGAGAALLRDPERIRELVLAMRGETSAPVSVKLRSGWDRLSINYLETAARAQEGGASLLCLHPRTRSQGFAGQADLGHLRILKQQIGLPVFGSGDLFSAEDAARMVEATGCDGVMFARGALGNPFIFFQARRLFSGLPPADPPTVQKRLATALEQLARAIAFQGERLACKNMRKHFCAYTGGIPCGTRLRAQVIRASSYAECRSLVEEYLSNKSFSI